MVVAATGFFDGVHLGHKAVIEQLLEEASLRRAASAVISFWPHPRTVLQKDAIGFRLLNSLEEKREHLVQTGVDTVHVLPFTKTFSRLSQEQFFSQYLRDLYHVSCLVVGYNHRLGHAHPGEESMEACAARAGIELVHLPEFVPQSGGHISSTKIRTALAQGRVEHANQWLGYPYSLCGVVVEGNRLGRTLGFPTANMKLYEPLKQLPANGVYQVNVYLSGVKYKGMTNIGFRPTVSHALERTIETHILDFDEDIYGLGLRIDFLRRLRPEIAFPSRDALCAQLRNDKENILSYYEYMDTIGGSGEPDYH